MTILLDRNERPGGIAAGLLPFERLARIVESVAPCDGGDLDRNVAMMAALIRLRMIDDPYAAARIIRSFRIGRDLEHDAAVEAIAVFVRMEGLDRR